MLAAVQGNARHGRSPLLRAFALERLAGVGLGAATARLPDSLAAEGRALCRLFDQEVSFQPSG
jgi:hypothetical protein